MNLAHLLSVNTINIPLLQVAFIFISGTSKSHEIVSNAFIRDETGSTLPYQHTSRNNDSNKSTTLELSLSMKYQRIIFLSILLSIFSV